MSDQFFVYGTLKRGQCNESVWPGKPVSIQKAWTHGALFAGPHYPAMKAGQSKVFGELWRFERSMIPAVTVKLDELEGTDGNGPEDLYHRLVVDVFDFSGKLIGKASTYYFVGDPHQYGFTPVQPGSDGYVVWPAAS